MVSASKVNRLILHALVIVVYISSSFTAITIEELLFSFNVEVEPNDGYVPFGVNFLECWQPRVTYYLLMHLLGVAPPCSLPKIWAVRKDTQANACSYSQSCLINPFFGL